VDDQDRANVKGLTSSEFDRRGTMTLRRWLEYWEGVLAGTQTLTPDSGDTPEMAPAQIAKLTREIDARENEGYAGPGRNRSWRR
jgi:hypothetical protein